jgi:hypothetical protein
MRRLFTTVALTLVMLTTLSGSAGDTAALTQGVDKLCQETGLRRAGPVQLHREFPNKDNRYWVKVPLLIDGAKHIYDIHLDEHFRAWQFRPTDWPFHHGEIPAGLGYDTFKEPHGRTIALEAVTRLNKIRKYKLYGSAAIQKVANDFLVTYETVSKAEQQKELKNIEGPLFVDPYVSFMVTPRGTVFGLFWGA